MHCTQGKIAVTDNMIIWEAIVLEPFEDIDMRLPYYYMML